MTHESRSRPLILDFLDTDAAMSGLADRGAVLIRRPGTSESDYTDFGDVLVRTLRHHATGSQERDLVRPDKDISTVNKGSDAIPLHREASYLPERPDVLLFYCERPPRVGGQTTLCDGVGLLHALPALVREYVQDGDGASLVWTWDLPVERWSAAFGTRSPLQAEEHFTRLREGFASWERLETHFNGDQLHGVFRTRCVIPTRFGGARSFCNSVMAYYDREPGPYVAKHMYHLALPDGSAFSPAVLADIRDYAERHTYELAWHPGDILLVDNARFMHGRRAVTDAHRRILVRLGKYRTVIPEGT
jgi:hypothetical protein